jgi:hypothetical protein
MRSFVANLLGLARTKRNRPKRRPSRATLHVEGLETRLSPTTLLATQSLVSAASSAHRLAQAESTQSRPAHTHPIRHHAPRPVVASQPAEVKRVALPSASGKSAAHSGGSARITDAKQIQVLHGAGSQAGGGAVGAVATASRPAAAVLVAPAVSGPVQSAAPAPSGQGAPPAPASATAGPAAKALKALEAAPGGQASTGQGSSSAPDTHTDELKDRFAKGANETPADTPVSQKAPEITTVRQLADLLGLPAQEVERTGMTVKQLAEFVSQYQQVDSKGGLQDPATWKQVHEHGTDAALKDAFMDTLKIPAKAAKGLSFRGVVEGAQAITGTGAGAEDPRAWGVYKDFRNGKISASQFTRQLAGVDANSQRTGTDGKPKTGGQSGQNGKNNSTSPSTSGATAPGRLDPSGRNDGNTTGNYGDTPPDQPAPGSTQGDTEFTVTGIDRHDDGTTDVFWTRSGGKDGLDGEYVTHYDGTGNYDVFSIGKDGDGERVGGGCGQPPADSVIGLTTDTTAPAGTDPRTGSSSQEALYNAGDDKSGNGQQGNGNTSSNGNGNNSSNGNNGNGNGSQDDPDKDKGGGKEDDKPPDAKPPEGQPEEEGSRTNPDADVGSYAPLWMIDPKLGGGEQRQTERDLDVKHGGGVTDPGPDGGSDNGGGPVGVTPAGEHQDRQQMNQAVGQGTGGHADAPSHTQDPPDMSAAQVESIQLRRSGGATDPSPNGDNGPSAPSAPALDGKSHQVVVGNGPKAGMASGANTAANLAGRAAVTPAGTGRIAK